MFLKKIALLWKGFFRVLLLLSYSTIHVYAQCVERPMSVLYADDSAIVAELIP